MGRWIKQDVPVLWHRDSEEVVLAGYRWSDDERWALVPNRGRAKGKFALVLISAKLTAVYVESRKEAEELLTEFASCSTAEIDKDRLSPAAKEELKDLMRAINKVRGSFLLESKGS